ncbi:MAG: hypothetical protein FJ241_13615 [Nitrospira sp.]|nr:hypothetical protein [Nitrospira sp.]
MQTVEERVDRLEALMGQFIVQVNTALLRFEKGIEELKDETRKETKRINKQWGDIARKMGTIVEDLIAPALGPVLSKYFGCGTKMEGQRMRKRLKGEEYEVDAIALCDDKVFMIEVRSTPKVEYVDEIVDKSKRFFEFFPEYRTRDLIIIFGGVSFADNVIQYATKNRVYVMAYREREYMDILNFDEIKKHFKKVK